MLTQKTIDISDLPTFFKNLGEEIRIQPVLVCEKGDREGFRLVLKGVGEPITVMEHGKPLRAVDVRHSFWVLREAYVLERLSEKLEVYFRGCL